jgi:CspA family cold shock protein
MTDRLLGRVKWFNNKAGFGFVTVLDGDRKDEDVFVHHSGINVSTEQYKYLVQGEYVSFTMKESDNQEHPFQAGDVTGLMGGKLMCETRLENRRESSSGDDESREQRPRRRGAGPRGSGRRSGGYQEGDVFVLQRQSRQSRSRNARAE